MSDGLNKFLEASGKTLETVPSIYTDVAQPAIKETGKSLSLVPRTINAMLVPLQQWIAKKEYNLAETEKLLAKKLENVGVEKIITPEPYVAVPAIQAISYSMDSEVLRNLYANLLAKSMNVDTKISVHPSFVEIIKQMSPLDSVVLNHISTMGKIPIVNLAISTNKSATSTRDMIKNITDFAFSSDTLLISVSIDNLKRLGLIEIPEKRKLVNYDKYKSIYEGTHFKFAKSTLNKLVDKDNGEKVVISRRFILKTYLGQEFIKICIND